MKLIAKRNIRNNLGDRVRLPGNAKHPLQIDKGTVFEIGTGEDVKKLPAEERNLVASLFVSGAVAEASDEKAVQAIKDEIAVDEKRETNRDAQIRKWHALPKV